MFSNFNDGTGRSRGCLGNDSAVGHVDIELKCVQNLLALVAVGIVVVGGPMAEVLWWRIVWRGSIFSRVHVYRPMCTDRVNLMQHSWLSTVTFCRKTQAQLQYISRIRGSTVGSKFTV